MKNKEAELHHAVSIYCQGNKTRWAKEINTFNEFGKWQNTHSF